MDYFNYTIDDERINLGDPTTYYKESLSLLKECQKLPEHHYELTQGIIAGPVGSGKSTTLEMLAKFARDLWSVRNNWGKYTNHNIDFFDAQDMGGLIEALQASNAYVKFVLFEDAIRKGLESRRTSSKENVKGSSKFFRIRHLVQEGGINVAGFIILFLNTQDLNRIEPSLREHAAIFIFKGYVRGCEVFIRKNEEILDELYDLSENATRIHKNDVRKQGFIIDKKGDYYKIITDIIPKKAKFPHERIYMREPYIKKDSNGKPLKDSDGKEIVYHVEIPYIADKSLFFMKESVYNYLKTLRLSELRRELGESHYSWTEGEYIRRIYKKYVDPPINWISTTDGTTYTKQLRSLENYVYYTLKVRQAKSLKLELKEIKVRNLTEGRLKGLLYKQLDQLKRKWSHCEVSPTDFTRAIWQAQARFDEWQIQKLLKQSEHINLKNSESNDRKPAPKMDHSEKVFRLLQVLKVSDLRTIQSIIKIPLNSLRNVFSDNKDQFENIIPGHGVYCNKGYEYTQEELGPFISKKVPMKKLKMEA